MGEHEKKPSGKRFRRGSAIKYRHPEFRASSTAAQLAKIKRRTCPSDEKQALRAALKREQERESLLRLKLRRLDQRVDALRCDIESHKAKIMVQDSLFLKPEIRPLSPMPLDQPRQPESMDRLAVDDINLDYNDRLGEIIHSTGIDEDQISDVLSLDL